MEKDNTSEDIDVECINCKETTTVKRISAPCEAVSLKSNICLECSDEEDFQFRYREWYVDKNDGDFL